MNHEFDFSKITPFQQAWATALKPLTDAIQRLREGNPFPTEDEDDEPTFTFRAQDILSVMVLDHYARLLEMYEPNGPKSVQVVDELNKFRAWQQANPGKVKLPD